MSICHTPNSERPLMMLRFRQGQEQGETWKRTFAELQKYRECCDEVWFSTGIGYPPLEIHRQLARKMAENAVELRNIGIIPSLQIQATLGHGDFLCASADCSSKDWTGYTGSDGTECRYCSCPRQEGLLRYFGELAAIYAAWHPGSIWLDDDLRIGNHQPVMEFGGCCCDHCIALFSKEEGHSYTRSELAEARRNDPALEARWWDFGMRGLALLTTAIARAVHAVSPETRIGIQHCLMDGRNRIFEAVTEATGMRAGSRPGGGAYTDHNPFGMIQKTFWLSQQMATQHGYDCLDQVCSEIETWPRVFSCKTSAGLRFESLLHLAIGMDSLSYFIMDQKYETPEWYGRELLAPLAAEAAAYKEFVRANAGTLPGGVGMRGIGDRPGMESIGVPCAADSPFGCCRLLDAHQSETLPLERLADFLAGDVVLEGAAVAAVRARGLGALICGVEAVSAPRLEEYWSDDPLNAGLDVGMRRAYDRSFRFEIPEGAVCRILGEYREPDGTARGIASALLTRPDGTRIAVTGCGLATDCVSTAQVRLLYRVFDWVAHGKLPALPEEPVCSMVIPRVTEEGALRSVTVLHTAIGEQKAFALRLRGVPPETAHVVWTVPGRRGVELDWTAGEEMRVTVPALAGWEAGWLELRK